MDTETKNTIDESKFSDLEEDFDENEEVVVEEAQTVSFNQIPTVTKSTGTSINSLVQITKSSDDITTNYDDLDLEFETFSGSLDDNIEKKQAPVFIKGASTAISSPLLATRINTTKADNVDEFSFVSPKMSNNNLISLSNGQASFQSPKQIHNDSTMDSSLMSNSTVNTSADDGDVKLNVLKTRDLNVSMPAKSFIRKSSNFKAVKVSDKMPLLENELKIKELTKVCARYDHKIKKIQEEIEYLDYLNANTPSIKEISKLRRAKELLMERLEGVRKEKYNKTVKLNHLIFKSPDMHGGEYWSRTVS